MQKIPNARETTQAIILWSLDILGKQLDSEFSWSQSFELVESRDKIDGNFGIEKFNL